MLRNTQLLFELYKCFDASTGTHDDMTHPNQIQEEL